MKPRPKRHSIEELVAPYDICRGLPPGAFDHSVFVWAEWSRGIRVEPFVRPRSAFDAEDGRPVVPAPTLQEALEALLPYAKMAVRTELLQPPGGWCATCRDLNSFAPNAADAALGVWEKLQKRGKAP